MAHGDWLIRVKLPDGTTGELRGRGGRAWSKAKGGLHVEEPETWLEYPLREGLRAALRLLPAPTGELVVGEVRVFPDHDRRDAGRWDPRAVSVAGVTARVLREIRIPAALLATRRILRDFRKGWGELGLDPFDPHGWLFGAQGIDAAASEEPRRPGPGRPPHHPRDLAVVADGYVRLLERGSPSPVLDLATELHRAPSTVRDQLGAARRAELLTSAPAGRAGGVLTPKARALLRSRSRGSSR